MKLRTVIHEPSQAKMPKRPHVPAPNSPPAVTPKKVATVEKVNENKRLLISPATKTNLVKIEILSKNGSKLSEDLPTKTLIELWQSLENDAEVDGCSSHRKHGGIIRAHFFLKKQISLGELHPEPEFTFERTTPIATDSFQCRIVGLGDVRKPNPGEIVTACITRTHFSATAEVIEQWIGKFGEIVTKPR
jgi:hypothetical protein